MFSVLELWTLSMVTVISEVSLEGKANQTMLQIKVVRLC